MIVHQQRSTDLMNGKLMQITQYEEEKITLSKRLQTNNPLDIINPKQSYRNDQPRYPPTRQSSGSAVDGVGRRRTAEVCQS